MLSKKLPRSAFAVSLLNPDEAAANPDDNTLKNPPTATIAPVPSPLSLPMEPPRVSKTFPIIPEVCDKLEACSTIPLKNVLISFATAPNGGTILLITESTVSPNILNNPRIVVKTPWNVKLFARLVNKLERSENIFPIISPKAPNLGATFAAMFPSTSPNCFNKPVTVLIPSNPRIMPTTLS